MTGLRQDLRYALRALRRTLGFTLAAIATLALGIGANTAVFSLVRGILLRPLPFAQPDRLYAVFEEHPQLGRRLASYPTFLDWRRQSRAFDGLVFIRGWTRILETAEGPEQVLAGYVSPDFLRVIGGSPRLGRGFLAEEERTGEPVAVISHALWVHRYGGASDVVGRTLPLRDGAVRIVGVMPPGFAYPTWASLWLPIAALPPAQRPVLSARGLHTDSRIVGRLAPGVGPVRARGEITTIAARLAQAYPAENAGWTGAGILPLTEELMGDSATRLFILQGAVVLVLLICCVNLANLSLARGMARSRELAVRTALGASRRRLIQQLLAECLVVALLGAIAGVVLAVWGVSLLKVVAPDVLPRLPEVSVDGPVLGFTAVLALVTTGVFGLWPAIRSSRTEVVARLSEGGRPGSGPRTTRLRSILVITELALAMILLVGAGLLLRSFDRLQRVALGFDPSHLITVRVMPPPGYEDPARAVELYQRLAAAVAALPGVRGVALTNHAPLTGGSMDTRVELDGAPADPGTGRSALFRTVSAEYFDTMGIPVLRGRGLISADLAGRAGALVVNQTFVRRYSPNADPVGRRLTVFKSVQARADFGERLEGTIVGVVGDVRHFSQDAELVPEVYLAYTRNPPTWIQLVVRSAGEPSAMIPSVRRAILAVEPGLPVAGQGSWQGLVTLEELLAESRAPRAFSSLLLLGFAATAVLLAVVGLYGVVAYLVLQRAREIGVRLALGARPADILALVVRGSVGWCLTGVAVGGIGARGLTRFLSTQLFGVTATDPATFLVVGLGLTAVALVATLLAARRAARFDPMLILRSE